LDSLISNKHGGSEKYFREYKNPTGLVVVVLLYFIY